MTRTRTVFGRLKLTSPERVRIEMRRDGIVIRRHRSRHPVVVSFNDLLDLADGQKRLAL